MREIDLHVHTSASDGTLSPEATVELAASLGLKAIAISDHDTVSGCAPAAARGRELGVEVVPAIEISTKYRGAVHILGYYIDTQSEELRPVLDWVIQDRDRRNRQMAELMAADGLPVSYEQMRRRFGPVIGRPHFAELLVELGLAKSAPEAFDRYVEKGRKYYLPRTVLPIEQAIATIIKAGGLPVLAHPFQYRLDEEGLRELVERCIELGLRGIECRYSGYTRRQSLFLENLAGEYGLLKTGGSDFHGEVKPHINLGRGTGGLSVPYDYLRALKEAAGSGTR